MANYIDDREAERDPMAELRSLGDPQDTDTSDAFLGRLRAARGQAQAPHEEPVGLSPTARALQEDGTLDTLAGEWARDRKIEQGKAFISSRKAQLRQELEEKFGAQTPAVEDPTMLGEFKQDVGRAVAGGIPKALGYFARQVAGSIHGPLETPEDPNDPNAALARGIRNMGQQLIEYGEHNLRAVPAPAVEDFTKISRESIGSFFKDASLWLASGAGQAVGYGVPMIGGGVVLGRALGGGGLGTFAGTTAFSIPLGVGEVREALEHEGITDEALIQSYTWYAGVAIGALDAIVPYDVLTTEVKRGLAKYMLVRVAKTGLKIGHEEAWTEATQEAIKIAAVAEARGLSVGENRQSEAIYNMGLELFEKRWEIAEAGAKGFVGGVTLGSGKIAGSARAPQEVHATNAFGAGAFARRTSR